MKDVMSTFEWHSSLGITDELLGAKKIERLANNSVNRSRFVQAGDHFLVHKSSKALWRISEDGQSIEPLFASDILTEADMGMEEGN